MFKVKQRTPKEIIVENILKLSKKGQDVLELHGTRKHFFVKLHLP